MAERTVVAIITGVLSETVGTGTTVMLELALDAPALAVIVLVPGCTAVKAQLLPFRAVVTTEASDDRHSATYGVGFPPLTLTASSLRVP